MALNVSCLLHVIWNCIKVYVLGGVAMVWQLMSGVKHHGDLPMKDDGVAIVTGGYSGVGYETAKGLLQHGMRVIIAGRDENKGSNAVAQLKAEMPACKVEFWLLDLMSLESVRQFADRFMNKGWPLHVLVNNAGCMMTPYQTTLEGYESQMGTNYLAHFLLTRLLLDVMEKSGTSNCYARIINVSSIVHLVAEPSVDDFTNKNCYSSHGSYAWSKLAAVLFTYELQKRLLRRGASVTVNALHPGVVDTGLYRNLHWFLQTSTNLLKTVFFKTPAQGAYTSLYLALSKQVEGLGARYYDNCETALSSTYSYDAELQEQLWTKTCDLLGVSNLSQSEVSVQ